MKGIVELTELGSGNKFLMPVKEIKSILSDGESGVFIETGVDNKGRSTGRFWRGEKTACRSM